MARSCSGPPKTTVPAAGSFRSDQSTAFREFGAAADAPRKQIGLQESVIDLHQARYQQILDASSILPRVCRFNAGSSVPSRGIAFLVGLGIGQTNHG